MTATFQTWAGSNGSTPARMERPTTEDEVAAAVQRAGRDGLTIKVVGGGHSWSEAACTQGVLLSLDGLSAVHEFDQNGREVEVGAGLRLRDLNALLDEKGLAMPVLGSISEQSVAGAISTGTHGSSPVQGSLASLVTALRVVMADGSVRDVTAESDEPLFRALQVGLGALGILVRVRLRVTEAFNLQEDAQPLPIEEAIALVPRLASERFAKVWWLPHTDWGMVYRYRTTTAASNLSALAFWVDERIVNRFVFPLILWVGRRWPSLVAPLNRVVRVAYFKRATRIGRSDRIFSLPMPPRHEEVEYAIPVERAEEALRFVRQLIEDERLAVNFIVELRYVAADEAWLSPAHGRATCFIGAYIARIEGMERYFRLFEEKMLQLGGRPHWGKHFQATRAQLAAAYPRFEDFDRLRKELDPGGLFGNPYLRRVFERAPEEGRP